MLIEVYNACTLKPSYKSATLLVISQLKHLFYPNTVYMIYMLCKIIYSAWNNKLDFCYLYHFFNNVLLHIYSQETYDHQVEIYNFLFLGSPVSCIVLYPVCKHFK